MPKILLPRTVSLRNSQHQRGLTMVELLVSMILGIFIIWATTTLYGTVKQSTRAMEANSRLVENGRAVIEIIGRNLRMARYFGCAGITDQDVTNHHDSEYGNQTNTATNGMDQQGLFGTNGSSGAPDTVTVFQAMGNEHNLLLEALIMDPTNLSRVIKLPAGHGIKVRDMISMTDCLRADVFNVSSVDNSKTPNELFYQKCTTCQHNYSHDAPILKVTRKRYKVNSTNNVLTVDDPHPLITGDEVELIGGVEDMQITYGVETRDITDPNDWTIEYLDADDVTASCTKTGEENLRCWRHVSTVRIALLLQSAEDNVVTRKQSYTFGGTSKTAADNRLRREFRTVVALRNYRP